MEGSGKVRDILSQTPFAVTCHSFVMRTNCLSFGFQVLIRVGTELTEAGRDNVALMLGAVRAVGRNSSNSPLETLLPKL